MKKIIIGADFVSTKENEEYFCKGELNKIIDKKIYDAIKTADFSIVNLELPIVKNKQDFVKPKGDGMTQKQDAVNGFYRFACSLNVSAVGKEKRILSRYEKITVC